VDLEMPWCRAGASQALWGYCLYAVKLNQTADAADVLARWRSRYRAWMAEPVDAQEAEQLRWFESFFRAPSILVYPEWQGGPNPAVHPAAQWLAEAFPEALVRLRVDGPPDDLLELTGGVVELRSISGTFERALSSLREQSPSRIFLIGGTCGTEAAPLAYLNERWDGQLAVVWFDAHADLNTPASSPSGRFHGMVLRTLLGQGPEEYTRHIRRPLTPRQVFLAGCRALDPPEAHYVEQQRLVVSEVSGARSGRVLAERIRVAGFHRAYVHLDVDVLDPASFSEMLVPTPGGPSLEQLTDCIQQLVQTTEVVGFSVVEYRGRSPESRAQLVRLLNKSGLLHGT
jgi:arginase